LFETKPHLAIGLLLASAVACNTGAPVADGSGEVASAQAAETAAPAEPLPASRELQRLRSQLVMQIALDPLVRADQFDVSVVGDGLVVVAKDGANTEATDRVAAIAALLPERDRIRVEGASGTTVITELRDAAAELSTEIALATRPEVEPELVVEGSGETMINRAASGERPRTWRVRPGDTLSLIAARTMGNGNQWQRIYEYNRSMIGANPERLREGMELRIPQD
jgi:hypothetical protein